MMSFAEFNKIVHESKAERMEHDTVYRIGRMISVRLSYILLRFFPRVSANQISVGIILLVIGVTFSNILYGLIDARLLILLQLIAIQIAALGDRVDGEIARFKSYFTQRGIYYDRVFHFLYPFALYVSMGCFFATLSGAMLLVFLSAYLALIASLSNMTDNLRHSIKYKIELEKHENVIRDYQQKPAEVQRPTLLLRVGHYAIFMMYDWVWMLYLVFAVLALRFPEWALYLYVAHLLFSLFVIHRHVLVIYPRRRLFSRNDFTTPSPV